MIGKFILVSALLMSPFFCGGMALALLFKHHHRDMPRLYMADLLGAGLGVPAVIWVMNQFGTPVAAFLTALPVLFASVWTSRGLQRGVPLLLMAGALAVSPWAEDLLEVEREERARVIYKHWDAMSKIKVYDFDGVYRGLNIDNVANSPVYPFDGNWATADTAEAEWGIDVSYLIGRFDSCTFLSLGAGGGTDVLQALIEGATEVHAVEVNRHINHMMLHGDPSGYLPYEPPPVDSAASDSSSDSAVSDMPDTIPADTANADSAHRVITLAEYSGHIYRDPRVRVVTEDARAYVRRHKGRFDVIFSLSSNSWAALASGAMALAENYLFTTEAFVDYWEALSDSGFMMMEHQVYMPRLVTEVMHALDQSGVVDVGAHFAIYDLPQMRRKMMLLSKQPLTDNIRHFAFGELTPERFEAIHLLYPPAHDSLQHNLFNRIVTEGWRQAADSARVEISPVTDDRPFIAQMGLWRNVKRENLERVIPYADFYGFPLSQLIILTILAIVIILVLPLNLLPYLFGGPQLRFAPWSYFFLIGLAFMAVEVVLIQKYGLLIGPSLYSIATVLLTLLIAAGLGSRVSNRIPDVVAFAGIVLWLLLDAFIFRHLIYTFGDLGQAARILVTALLILPLGFFMGMPFPKATRRVRELIDWGFAVNGAASVLGATLVLLVAFRYGFTVALAGAAGVYLLAYLVWTARRAW
jgi:hypothetical protein